MVAPASFSKTDYIQEFFEIPGAAPDIYGPNNKYILWEMARMYLQEKWEYMDREGREEYISKMMRVIYGSYASEQIIKLSITLKREEIIDSFYDVDIEKYMDEADKTTEIE